MFYFIMAAINFGFAGSGPLAWLNMVIGWFCVAAGAYEFTHDDAEDDD